MEDRMPGTSAIRTGFLGGAPAYYALRRMGRRVAEQPHHSGVGAAYQGRSKLEVLFGPSVWRHVVGKTVIDMGSGKGLEAVEAARRGARRVIGVEILAKELHEARDNAARAGVADRCVFTTRADERADVILSIDGFEHYDDPGGMLSLMRELLLPGGRVLVAFGPPWFHPLGGHLFSIVPWAHLVFSERALIRWRSDFKDDGATCFREVAGGLNQMTVRRFERLVARSDFALEGFEAVPIRRLRWLASGLTRELVTSIVRCTLVPRPMRP
jgi:SAM-dependent methyltransferase